MVKSSTWDQEHARYRRKEGWLDRIGFPASDRMINLRVTIDMSFRFRFALLLCGFIILVNILFKVQTDIVEMSIYKHSKAAFYHPPSQKSEDQLLGGERKDESAADLADPPNGKFARMRNNRLMRSRFKQADEDTDTQRVEEAVAVDNPRVNKQVQEELDDQQGSCVAGHIPGLKDICDSKGCLRRLKVHARGSPRKEPIPESDKRNIDFLPGWVDPSHYDLIPLVTDIQWSEGVYGSVGELIAGVGKLTSLLSYNVDQSVGELLFVSDDFIGHHQQHVVNSDGKSTYDSFVENISHCGYTVTDLSSDVDTKVHTTGTKTVYVHKGNVLDLDKELFQRWNVPQFRLVVIEADQDIDSIAVLKSLIISSCILSDGGILIVNGVDDSLSQDHVISCLSQYFSGVQASRPVLVPLLNAGNKLYLTTLGYKQLYTEYLARYSAERLGTTLLQVTTKKFGTKFTYLTMDD